MPPNEHQHIEALALAALQTLTPPDQRSEEDPSYHAQGSDYYRLLSVARDADTDTIERALDAQSQREDLPLHVRTALHNAAAVLLDPDLRARYNASL